VTLCRGEPDIDSPIPDIEVKLTKREVEKTILVNIVSSDNRGVGQLRIPPNMLREGWNVSIRTVQVDNSAMTRRSECDDGQRRHNSVEAVSQVLEIEVTDSRGKPVKHFDHSFKLSLFAVIKDDHYRNNDVCLGYSNNYDDDEGWKCDGTSSINSTGESSVFLVETTSDHLTSFAVLLGSAGNGERDGCGSTWGWIQIASLVITGTAIALVIIVTTLFYCSPPFRAWIMGRDEDAVMSYIRKAIARAQQKSR